MPRFNKCPIPFTFDYLHLIVRLCFVQCGPIQHSFGPHEDVWCYHQQDSPESSVINDKKGPLRGCFQQLQTDKHLSWWQTWVDCRWLCYFSYCMAKLFFSCREEARSTHVKRYRTCVSTGNLTWGPVPSYSTRSKFVVAYSRIQIQTSDAKASSWKFKSTCVRDSSLLLIHQPFL